jgi:MFS family permease
MLGGIAGNLLAAWIGDTFGGKPVGLMARVLFIIVAIGGLLANSSWMFLGIFFLYGMAFYSYQVSVSTMNIEVATHPRKATAFAVLGLCNVPFVLGASILSGQLWNKGNLFSHVAIPTIMALVISTVYLSRIPRRKSPAIVSST